MDANNKCDVDNNINTQSHLDEMMKDLNRMTRDTYDKLIWYANHSNLDDLSVEIIIGRIDLFYTLVSAGGKLDE